MSLIKSNFPKWPMMTDFFDDAWLNTRFNNGNWMPAVNVIDNEKFYEIELVAPGFRKEDFNVIIENGILTINAKVEKEEEETEKNYTRREFSMRSFVKNFTLPENVMDEEIEAKYEEGVLRLMLNKTEKALPPKKEIVIN